LNQSFASVRELRRNDLQRQQDDPQVKLNERPLYRVDSTGGRIEASVGKQPLAVAKSLDVDKVVVGKAPSTNDIAKSIFFSSGKR